MPKKSHVLVSDLQGIAKMTRDAVVHSSHVVEAMQRQIINPSFLPSTPIQRLITALSGGVHKTLRFTARRVGNSTQHALSLLDPERSVGLRFQSKRKLLAIINGVLGDYLSRKKNPLAQPMQVIFQGEPLAISAAGEWPESAAPTGKILLLVHGLCMDESGWSRDAHNHGEALAEALRMTPIYLRYNTGLHVSENGAGLSELLEELLAAWPVAVEELVLVAHSMGGLVSRSAVHLAQTENKAWANKLRKMVFLGTPHHGTSLEKVGNHVHALLDSMPYTKPLAKIGGLRSAGITDLRFGNLLEQDWAPHGRFERHTDARQPLPLSPEIRSYAIAATLGADENDLKSTLAGDGLVPLDSALGQHGNPAQQLAFAGTQTLYKTGHLELLGSQTAFAVMKDWLQE